MIFSGMPPTSHRHWYILCLTVTLAGCGGFQTRDSAPQGHFDASGIADAVPRAEPRSRYGNPQSYQVNGVSYQVMQSAQGYVERGIASWYGTKFHGRRTSSGEPYDMYAMTAAHKTLPLPTYVRVTNLDNQLSVVVKVNDRGPFHDDRLIDLSYAAATKLGISQNGTGRVEIRALSGDDTGEVIKTASSTPQEGKDKEGLLFLQIGAFSQRENLEQILYTLINADFDNIHIRRSSDTGTIIHRVRIGPLANRAEADAQLNRLLGLGLNQTHVIVETR